MDKGVEITSFSNMEHDPTTEKATTFSRENGNKNHEKHGKVNSAYEPSGDEGKISDYETIEKFKDEETVKIDVSEEDETEKQANIVLRMITYPVLALTKSYREYKKLIGKVVLALFVLGITAYMIVAMVWDFNRALPLFVVWCLTLAYVVYAFIRDHYGDSIWEVLMPVYRIISKNMFWIKWVFILCIVAGLAVWIALDTSKRPNQLISGGGYLVFLFGLFITSRYPDKVKWRPVLWGLLIQICLAMFILRTDAGYEAFNWLSNIVQIIINFVDAGVIFVFGESFGQHYFAFRVMSIIIYFSAIISVLYYLGVIQWLIFKMAWLMQISLNTSATESMVAAGNVFLGQTESPLLIRPYLKDLTTSELHAVMTCGFGTVAGSTLGAYLSFGIDGVYLITSCFMSAPCALALSKLVFPETKKSKFANREGLELEKTDQRNIFDALANGASLAIPLVANIVAVIIAFISILDLFNGFLSWFGGLLNFSQLSFQLICSYIFLPITYLMGIDWTFCFKAAELIGTKIFLNEFIAYEDLSKMIELRDSGTVSLLDPTTGIVNWVDERTEAIITYALCGFANVGSIGIMLGGLGAITPHRRGEMATIVIRALISGVFVSVLNACIAGFLYVPKPILCDNMLATTNWTNTEPSRLYQCCAPFVESPSSNPAVESNCCCSYDWSNSGYNLSCLNITC